MKPSDARPAFVDIGSIGVVLRECEHNGIGPIDFRRVLDKAAFASAIDFVDFTVVPPGSSIGQHTHSGNEELYYVVSGQPVIAVNGRAMRCGKGAIAVVRDGESHELINDTSEPIESLVMQVSLPEQQA